MRAAVLAAVVFGIVLPAHAESTYDGSKPMKCAIQTVMVCDDPSVCVRGTAQTVSMPSVVVVDVGQRLISGEASGRTAEITSTGQAAGKLMLAGRDVQTLGKMWGLVIEQKTGAMSGAVLSHGGGYLMFGACTAP